MENDNTSLTVPTENQVVLIQKYPALRVIAAITKYAAIAFSFLFLYAALNANQIGLPSWAGFAFVVIGFMIVISLLAISEGIKLFIDIEQNTRSSYQVNN